MGGRLASSAYLKRARHRQQFHRRLPHLPARRPYRDWRYSLLSCFFQKKKKKLRRLHPWRAATTCRSCPGRGKAGEARAGDVRGRGRRRAQGVSPGHTAREHPAAPHDPDLCFPPHMILFTPRIRRSSVFFIQFVSTFRCFPGLCGTCRAGWVELLFLVVLFPFFVCDFDSFWPSGMELNGYVAEWKEGWRGEMGPKRRWLTNLCLPLGLATRDRVWEGETCITRHA
jgi:hypothetical protein